MFTLVHDVIPDVCTTFEDFEEARRIKTGPLKTAEDGA